MIKFVKPKNAKASVRVPEETRTKGRVYATIGKDGKVKAKPHAHAGYNHVNGRKLSKSEKALMERISKYWKEYQDGR